MSDAALRELVGRAVAGDDEASRRLAGEARAQARDVLADDRYRPTRGDGEGPLHDVFATIGDWLDELVGAMPGGDVSGWVLIAIVVAAVVATAASLVLRRRGRRGAVGPALAEAARTGTMDPGALEREAAEAERRGDLDTAVRLRFQAGLLRLHAARAIELRPSSTSGSIGRRLRSPAFDELAGAHDAIAYGGRGAASGDVQNARERWPAVVREAGRR